MRLTGKVYDFYVKNNSSKRFTNTTSYTFSNNSDGNSTSAQVATYTSKVGTNAAVTSTYTYDNNGNITKIVMSNGTEFRYEYDNLGQLLREDNTANGRTYVYTYDNAGNILTKKECALTAAKTIPSTIYSTNTYGYNDASWGDLLTSFNGHSITYDSIGNPLSYYNGSSSYNFIWKDGRRLAIATKGSYTLSFNYNDDGIRTEKIVNGVVHTYYLAGSQIEAEKWGDNLCVYIYDAAGSPIGMQYRTTSMAEGAFDTFWFEKNLQGDIIAVYNESGVKVLTYTYDAWGNFTRTWYNSTGTNYNARFNPFTYRGYYYDSETGFYYLQSRYYDPAIGRFINADGYINANGDIIGFNMFAYCSNNPILFTDPSGEGKAWDWFKNNVINPVGQVFVTTTFAIIDFVKPNNNINTLGTGINLSLGCGGNVSASANIAIDRKGDIGVNFSLGGGGEAGCGLSVTRTTTISSASTINDLHGLGGGAGASVTVPVYGHLGVCAGYDFSVGYDETAHKPYMSSTFSKGVSYGPAAFEVHGQVAYTWVSPSYNFFEN